MIKLLISWLLQVWFAMVGVVICLVYLTGNYEHSHLVIFLMSALVWSYGMYITRIKGQFQ